MDENEQKAAYAVFLLESATPFEAALKLFPSEKDRGQACRVAFSWPNDPEVLAKIEEIKSGGHFKNSKVPSKEDVVEQLWNLTKNEKVAPKDRATAGFMVAKMLKYVDAGDLGESMRMPTAPVYKVVTE